MAARITPSRSSGRTRLAVLTTALALLVAGLLLVSPAPATAAVVMSGTADATGATGPAWRRTTWTPTTTGPTTLTLAWTGTADLNLDLRTNTGQWIASAATTGNPETLTATVTAGTTYRIAVWAVTGAATYTVTTSPPVNPPEPPAATLQHGRVDATAASAPSVVPARFTPQLAGPVTVRLSWTGTANLTLRLERVDTGAVVGTAATVSNPEVVTATLVPGVQYRARVSAVSGAADYAVRVSGHRPWPTPPSGAPNILVIEVDDARPDALVVMDAVQRWFTAAGTTYPNAYVTTPACCPSRAALMSGQYDHNNHQTSQNTPGFTDADSIQRHLREAGYLTGHSGKFIHWYALSSIAPYWDRWNYFQGGYNDVWMNRDGYTHQSSGYSTIRTFDRAIEFAEDFDADQDARPWLLQVTPIAPHRPSTPEPQYAAAPVPAWTPDPSVGEVDRSDKPAFVRTYTWTRAEAEAERAQMLRTLMTVDDQVDRLMTRLQQLGELDNTLAVFTSDNGVFWGEHQLPEKFMPYRRATEVPLILRWPGHVAAGATNSARAANIDLAPTVLAAAKVPATHVMDGRDLLNNFSRTEQFTEYWLDPANGGVHPTWASIRTAALEFNVYYDQSGAVTFREYYNLTADPYELVNLLADGNAANDPDVSALQTRLTAYRSCRGSTCP